MGGPKNLGDEGPRRLGWGCGWPQEKRYSPACIYRTQFRRSRSNRSAVGRGPKKIRGTNGSRRLVEAWLHDPLESRYSCTCVTILYFVALAQTVWARVGGSKTFGDTRMGSAPFEWGCGWPTRSMSFPYLCHHAKFGHSTSNRTSVEICDGNVGL